MKNKNNKEEDVMVEVVASPTFLDDVYTSNLSISSSLNSNSSFNIQDASMKGSSVSKKKLNWREKFEMKFVSESSSSMVTFFMLSNSYSY